MTEKNPIHLLFYSKSCIHSEKFISILKQFPTVDSLFKKHAVEDLQQLPDSLEQVPAVVVNGEHLLEGSDAFNWLEKQVKDSFSAGPDLDKKSGYSSELGYSFLGDQKMDELNTSTFSSVNLKKEGVQQQNDNNPPKGVSKKENDMNRALEQYQRERNSINLSTPGLHS